MPRIRMSSEEETISKRLAQARFAKTDKGKRTKRNAHLVYQYGITIDQYEAMSLSQNHVCKICKQAETTKNSRGEVRYLAVDHCHQSGKVRGLLCNSCNTLLGRSRDDISILEEAIKYLKEAK